MAIWKDARVEWDGVVISSSVRAAALELGADAPEQTAMGDNFRQMAGGGLKTASVELELNWAAGSTTGVDSLFGSSGKLGNAATFKIRPTTGAIAAGNPEYSGSFVVTAFTPMQGAAGDQHVANVSLQAAGDITRAIST